MNILLVREDSATAAIITLALESRLQAQVFATESVQSAIDTLLGDHEIHLILSDVTTDTTKLFKYVLTSGNDIPFLLLTKEKEKQLSIFPDIKVLGCIDLKSGPDEIIKFIEEGVKSGHIKVEQKEENFCRIKTELLLKVVPLKGDVYIRLSAQKFVKLFKKGDTFTVYHLDRMLVEKKIQYLYILKSNVEEFMEKLSAELTSQIAAATEGDDPEQKTHKITVATHEAVHELTQRFGFNKQVQELVKANMQLALKTVGTNPRLSKMMSFMHDDEGRYISAHSIMTANVACSIAAKMQWPSNTTFNKLTLAALLHDVNLANHRLAAVASLEDLEKVRSRFSTEEYQAFKNHPFQAAEMIKTMTEIPQDVDVIVAQHHERPDGSGFPRGLQASYIAPLSSVFIVAHDIVQFVIETKGKGHIKDFIEKISKLYSSATFKKIIQVLG